MELTQNNRFRTINMMRITFAAMFLTSYFSHPLLLHQNSIYFLFPDVSVDDNRLKPSQLSRNYLSAIVHMF